MYRCESWTIKKAECWRNDVFKLWCSLDKILESPLDSKEIKPVNSKGNQPWIFIGRTDAEAPILWPPDAKSQLIGKDPDTGKDWGQEKGTTEFGWHHWLNGHGFGWTPGVGDGQGSLACCSPWGCKESDTTEQLNWIELGAVISAFYRWEGVAEWVERLASRSCGQVSDSSFFLLVFGHFASISSMINAPGSSF